MHTTRLKKHSAEREINGRSFIQPLEVSCMNRTMQKYLTPLTRILCLLAALMLPMAAQAADDAEMRDRYITVSTPIPTSGDKIQVLEFFWYGCPHCYSFHPIVEDWAADLPDDVEFSPVAAPLNPHWVPHARAFFAAEILGVSDQFHDAFFNAWHKKRQRIIKPDDLADFAGSLGIDRQKFYNTMRSFAVENKIKRARYTADRLRINSVPTVVVNGRYLVTARSAGGQKQMIEVMDYLIDKERAAMRRDKQA